MSALPLPASPLPLPGKLPSQPNNAAPAESRAEPMPFASVLHQKVVASTAKGQQSPSAPNTQAGTQDTAAAEVAAAQALASGEYAQNALQTLLPWLQSVQGQAGQDESPDMLGSELTTSSLPTDASPQPTLALSLLAGPLTPATPAGSTDMMNSKRGLRAVSENATQAAVKVEARAESTTDAANLAASTDAQLTAENPISSQQDGAASSPLPAQSLQTSRFDAALQQASEQLSNHAAKASGESVRLQAALGSPQWQDELGDQIHLMSRQNDSRAELVLTPAQLGRIEISLDISGDQASAMFISANPEVRTALEGAMDRLREVLANNGITLGQTHVGAESSSQSTPGEHSGNRHNGVSGSSVEGNDGTATAWTRHSNNMLDVFA